jgi:hypothetical protein
MEYIENLADMLERATPSSIDVGHPPMGGTTGLDNSCDGTHYCQQLQTCYQQNAGSLSLTPMRAGDGKENYCRRDNIHIHHDQSPHFVQVLHRIQFDTNYEQNRCVKIFIVSDRMINSMVTTQLAQTAMETSHSVT